VFLKCQLKKHSLSLREVDDFDKISRSNNIDSNNSSTIASQSMPVIRDGETYSSFSRRVKKARYNILSNLSETQRCEENQEKHGVSNISVKRKSYVFPRNK
jgi:hypothetical protein